VEPESVEEEKKFDDKAVEDSTPVKEEELEEPEVYTCQKNH